MSSWSNYVASVSAHLAILNAAGCADPFFRGQRENWPLLPSLARHASSPNWHDNKEARLFFRFRDAGGHLMPATVSGWGQLFYMQHHGVPTRLLDWTESFGSALYFALRKAGTAPVVWVLNPYLLNSKSGNTAISTLHTGASKDYIATLNSGFPPGHSAVAGDPWINRLRHQQGAFTCAGFNLHQSLEEFCPEAAMAFPLPPDAVSDAHRYLGLFGFNDFTVFPDLDGLARTVSSAELGLPGA